MTKFDRRCFLAGAASQFALGAAQVSAAARTPTIGFGFGTYGMQSLTTGEAIRQCAEIGYDGIELALMTGWPTEPTLLARRDRAEIRAWLIAFRMEVPSLLESLHCLRTEEIHLENVEKLKRAAELAHDLAPDNPPVVQSIVGGKTPQWEQMKHRLVDRLADWAKVGEASKTLICFKPHASHIVHDAERALWLHQQVGSDWLKVVYDYSHFYLEGFALAASLKQLLPITPYVQVKDSRGTPESHEYLLPGDGQTDYVELLNFLKQASYDGFVNVEVSSMIHRKPGYQAIPTAKLCYERLAPLFERVGIQRPSRS
jgi:sugar phosphate isomerase/epimerase